MQPSLQGKKERVGGGSRSSRLVHYFSSILALQPRVALLSSSRRFCFCYSVGDCFAGTESCSPYCLHWPRGAQCGLPPLNCATVSPNLWLRCRNTAPVTVRRLLASTPFS